MNERLEKIIKEVEEENNRLQRMIYPYVGISNGILNQVILFTAPRTGTNINGKGWPAGYYSDGWDEKSFIPYYGQILITNGRIKKSDDNERSNNKWEKIEVNKSTPS